MGILEQVKNYVIKGNVTIDDFLQEKHGDKEHGWKDSNDEVIFYFSPTKKLADNPLSSPAQYKWKIEDNKIVPISSKAIELTPELDEGFMELQAKKDSVQPELMRVYNFINQKHGVEDFSEDEATRLASEEFGLTEKEVYAIYIKVEKILYSK